MFLPYSIECLNNVQFFQVGVKVLEQSSDKVDKEIISLLTKTSLVKSFSKWANLININKYDSVYKNADANTKITVIKEIMHKFFFEILQATGEK